MANFDELLKKQQETISQFTFMVFVPNPINRTAQVFIDSGEIKMVLKIENLIDAIKEICNEQEALKIKKACMEYGTPFLYDRNKRELRELTEKEPIREINFRKLLNEYEETTRQQSYNGAVSNESIMNISSNIISKREKKFSRGFFTPKK
jgi:lipopolysaccharide biosynthesis regulator YciM